jgi:hypothetical protein
MTASADEAVVPVFTAEQRHVLGMLYGFLIQLGQQRLRRLEQEKPHEEEPMSKPRQDADRELHALEN